MQMSQNYTNNSTVKNRLEIEAPKRAKCLYFKFENCQFFWRVKLYLCLKAKKGCEGLLSVVVISIKHRSLKNDPLKGVNQRERSPFAFATVCALE